LNIDLSVSFTTDQTSSLLIQFYGGLDIPHHVDVLLEEGDIAPKELKLDTIWYLGARLVFDWRHYF